MQNFGYSYQEIITLVEKSISNNTLFHSCIIYGDSGSGKTYLCAEIAKFILNYNQNNNYSDHDYLKSPSIYAISNNIFNEVSIISVDTVRDIKSFLKHTAINSKYKIVLIDDIDKMNKNSENALLKILEEPIGNTVYIFNTANINEISDTFKSRCIKFKLAKISYIDFKTRMLKLIDTKFIADIELLHKLCNGDVNLAVEIVKNHQFLKLIHYFDNKQFNEILNLINDMNLSNNINLKLFKCVVSNLMMRILELASINTESFCIISNLHSNFDKIQYIITNLRYLSLRNSQQTILSILKGCLPS